MTHRGLLVIAALAATAAVAVTPASADSPREPLGSHVSECAQMALGQRIDPPAVTCTHDGHVHSFATFGELVAHLKEHHG